MNQESSNGLKLVFLVVMLGVTFFSRGYYKNAPPNVSQTDVTRAAAVVVLTGSSAKNASDILVTASSPVTQEAIRAPETTASPLAATPAAPPALEAPSTPDPSSAFYRTRFDEPPEITAHAALVADVMTGEVYFEKHASVHWPTASLAKLMTAAVAIDALKPGSVFTVTDTAVQAGDDRLTSVFHPGDTYTVSDLLKALLVASANEAAETLAISYGREQFIARMNQSAALWGLNDTYFYDPAGISVANQSTAHDLAMLVSHLWDKYNQIFQTTRAERSTIVEQTKRARNIIVNTHALAGKPYYWGGKTGYTPDASGNLISIFNLERRPVLVIVLGTEDRFGETETLFNWFKNDFTASH